MFLCAGLGFNPGCSGYPAVPAAAGGSVIGIRNRLNLSPTQSGVCRGFLTVSVRPYPRRTSVTVRPPGGRRRLLSCRPCR